MKPAPLLAAVAALVLIAVLAVLMVPPPKPQASAGASTPGAAGALTSPAAEQLAADPGSASEELRGLRAEPGGAQRNAHSMNDPGPWLEVVDPQGRPIPGAEIYWADPFAELSSGKGLFENVTITGAAGMDQLLLDRGERATADETGRWRLPEFSRAVHVHARFEEATALTTLRAEELQEVQRLVLKATARFEIHFVNAAGEPEPVPQLVVDVRKRDGDAWRTSRSLSAFGSEGRFVLPLPALLNARSTADLGLAHPPGLFRPPGGYGFEIAAPPTEPVEWVVPPKARMVLRLEGRMAPGWRGLKAVRAEVDFEALGLLPNQPRPVPRVAPISEIEASTRESAGPGDGDWLVFLGDVEVQTPLKITLEFESGAVLGPLSVSGPPVANQTHVIAIADPGATPEVGVRFQMRELGGSPMDRAELHVTLVDARGRRLAAPLVVDGRSDDEGIVRIESPWIFASSWPEDLRADAWPAPFKLFVQADWQGRRWMAEQPLEIEGAQEPGTVDLGEVLFLQAQPWLEGNVLDHSGRPVAGAQVNVLPTNDLDSISETLQLQMLKSSHGLDLMPGPEFAEYSTRSNGNGLFRFSGNAPERPFLVRAETRREITTSNGRTWTDKQTVEQHFQAVGQPFPDAPDGEFKLKFKPRFAVHGRLQGDADRLSRVKLGIAIEATADAPPEGRDLMEAFLSVSDNVQYDGTTGEWCVWTSKTRPMRLRVGVLGELGEQFSTAALEPVDNSDSGGLDLGVGQLQPPTQPPMPPGEDG